MSLGLGSSNLSVCAKFTFLSLSTQRFTTFGTVTNLCARGVRCGREITGSFIGDRGCAANDELLWVELETARCSQTRLTIDRDEQSRVVGCVFGNIAIRIEGADFETLTILHRDLAPFADVSDPSRAVP